MLLQAVECERNRSKPQGYARSSEADGNDVNQGLVKQCLVLTSDEKGFRGKTKAL
jgi:hypothetical protein